jgi:hypothetical protein
MARFYRGSHAFQLIWFVITAGSALAMAAGVLAPITTLVTFVGLTAVHGRNECINDSADKMLRVILFWMMMMPPTDIKCWHIPGMLLPRQPWPRQPTPVGGVSWGSVGLLLQVWFIYIAVVLKRRGSVHWYGDTWAGLPGYGADETDDRFSAVWYTVAAPFASSALGRAVAMWPAGPDIYRLMTASGILAEALGPTLLLVIPVDSPARLLPVAILIGLQFGIQLLAHLPHFGFVAGATMLAFVPTPTWPRLPADDAAALRKKTDSDTPTPASPSRLRASSAEQR